MVFVGVCVEDSVIGLSRLYDHYVPSWSPKVVQVSGNRLSDIIDLGSLISRCNRVVGDLGLDLSHVRLSHVARPLPVSFLGREGEGKHDQNDGELFDGV